MRDNDTKIFKKMSNCTIFGENQIIIDYKHTSNRCSDVIHTTRLVLDNINNNFLYGRVYWSSANNIVRRNSEGKWILGLDFNCEKVIIEGCNDLLFDEKYIKKMIEDLLDKERVSKILDGKVEEYNYIGSLRIIDDEYAIIFDKTIEKSLSDLSENFKRK